MATRGVTIQHLIFGGIQIVVVVPFATVVLVVVVAFGGFVEFVGVVVDVGIVVVGYSCCCCYKRGKEIQSQRPRGNNQWVIVDRAKNIASSGKGCLAGFGIA